MSKHYYIADSTQPRGFVGISESEFLAVVDAKIARLGAYEIPDAQALHIITGGNAE